MTDVDRERAGVLCAGSLLVDIAKVIDAYPTLERLAMIEHISTSTGGPGLNMAVDLRMLGAPFPVAVAGVVGQDAHGDYLLAECAGLGIDTSAVLRSPEIGTSFTDAMVERHGGKRTFFHHVGANALFRGAHAAIDRSNARILHLGAPGIHPAMDRADADGSNGWSVTLARARAAGMRTNLELVSVEPGRIAALARPCLPLLDSLIVNELEAGAVTGIDPPRAGIGDVVDWPRLEAMARGLTDRGVAQLAVVHFPAGCVAADPAGGVWRQGSLRLSSDEVRSTTGAGDAFAAGVLLGIHESWPVEDALRLGVAAAGLCVLSPTTSSGLLAADACLTEARRIGFRPTG